MQMPKARYTLALLFVLVAAVSYAGIKDAQIQQFPPADLTARTIALNIKSVGATSSRDALYFTVPEDWIVTGIRGCSRALSGTITAYTVNVNRTTAPVTGTATTMSILRNAIDLYGAGLASAGTCYDGTLVGDGRWGQAVILNAGDTIKLNYVMTGSNTPLATDVSWQLTYRPLVGYER